MGSSCIFLDGWVLWVILAYLLFQFIAFLVVGIAWLKAERELDEKKEQLSKLRHGYNVLIGKYHRDTFKLAEVDAEGDKQ